MRYLLMIYSDETIEASMSKEEQEAFMAGYFAFTQATRDRNAFVAGEALQSIATATTVRVRNGKTVTTDGPFAETKEQLGGYYLLSCQNLDKAIEFAAMIPGARARGSDRPDAARLGRAGYGGDRARFSGIGADDEPAIDSRQA